MSENGEEPRGGDLHVVFGTGPVGLAVAGELSRRGRRVRLVNRSGRAAAAPEGAEVVGGDATNEAFAREASAGASVVRAWHLPNPETVTTRRFVELVFEEAGGPAKIQRAPRILLRALGLFNPAVRETIEMLYEFEEPFVVDHSKFARLRRSRHAARRGRTADRAVVRGAVGRGLVGAVLGRSDRIVSAWHTTVGGRTC